MIAWTDVLAGFWSGLVNHLWQSSLVLLVLLLLDGLLRRAPAALRADLWTLGMLKLALPATLGGAAFVAAARRLGGEAPAVGAVVATALAPARESEIASVGWISTILMLATAVWLGGVVVGGWRLGRDLLAQSRLLAGARPVTDDPLLRAATRAGVPIERLLVAPGVTLPLVLGWWSPRILVPGHLTDIMGSAGLTALLRHEERHRRRRDPLRLLLGRALVAVFWFYPPARWVLRRTHECSEFACDEAALEAGVPTGEYLRTLALTIRRGLDPGPPVAAAASGGSSLMHRRLARLRRKERPTMKAGRWMLLAAMLVVTLAAVTPLDLVAHEPAPHGSAAKSLAKAPPPEAERLSNQPPDQGAEKRVVAPRMTRLVEPEYPESARGSDIEGAVILRTVIDRGGEIVEIEVLEEIEGRPEFAGAALRALEQCEFEPGTIDGRPARISTTIKINFRTE